MADWPPKAKDGLFPDFAWRDEVCQKAHGLSPKARLLAHRLAKHCKRKTGICQKALEDLAIEVGVTKAPAREALEELANAGFVVRGNRRNGLRTGKHRLCFPRAKAAKRNEDYREEEKKKNRASDASTEKGPEVAEGDDFKGEETYPFSNMNSLSTSLEHQVGGEKHAVDGEDFHPLTAGTIASVTAQMTGNKSSDGFDIRLVPYELRKRIKLEDVYSHMDVTRAEWEVWLAQEDLGLIEDYRVTKLKNHQIVWVLPFLTPPMKGCPEYAAAVAFFKAVKKSDKERAECPQPAATKARNEGQTIARPDPTSRLLWELCKANAIKGNVWLHPDRQAGPLPPEQFPHCARGAGHDDLAAEVESKLNTPEAEKAESAAEGSPESAKAASGPDAGAAVST